MKKRFIHLNDAQRSSLERGFRAGKGFAFRQRCHYLLLSDQGYDAAQIGEIFGTTRQALYRWFDRFEKSGIEGLRTRPRSGAPPKLEVSNEHLVKSIKDLIDDEPRNLNGVVGRIEQEFGHKIESKDAQSVFKKINYRWKRFRNCLKDKRNEELYQSKRKALEVLGRLFENRWIDLFFADQVTFSLTPSIPYGWLPIGQQTGLPTQRRPVMKLFGLLTLDNRFLGYPTTGKIDADFVIHAIDQLANRITKPTVVVLDNASFHHRAAGQKALEWERKNLFLFFLPPYSPHLNRIEILWKFIKYKWLKPKDYLNEDTLWEAIIEILKNIGGQYTIAFSTDF